MKKSIFTLIAFAHFAIAQAQDTVRGVGIGIQIGRYQDDFGIGLHLSSPHFLNDMFAVKLRANYLYFEHIEAMDGTVVPREYVWTPYFNASLGLAVFSASPSEHIELYGEGGLMIVLPDEAFSSEDYGLGGYGLFGFAFANSPFSEFFLEVGGAGHGLNADRIQGTPSFGNGLIISAGFRVVMRNKNS